MNKFYFLFIIAFSFAQKTHFEKSNFLETVHPDHVLDFYQELEKSSNFIKIKKVGYADYGTALHNIIISQKKIFTVEQKKDEFVFMIQNGIHSGESCGIDASQLFARYILNEFKKHDKFKDIIFVIIPVYNLGGHQKFSPYNRVNQNGPVKMGFRGNARNYDLNRDYLKMDTENMKVFADVFHSWQAHAFLDNHSTDGADYQYAMTYMINETEFTLEPIRNFVSKTLKPAFLKDMDEAGYPAVQYVSLTKRDDIKSGINYFHLAPRYSTGYTELFNTISILVETHMLKPYEIRVKSNFEFIKSLSKQFSIHKKEIQRVIEENKKVASSLNEYAISRKLNREKSTPLKFKGYEYEKVFNKYANTELVKYDRTKPFESEIPLYMNFDVDKMINVPEAYIIPQEWVEVIDRLKKNNVILKSIESEEEIMVSQYRLTNPKWSSRAYEGHQMLSSVDINTETKKRKFRKGDVLVEMNQPSNIYLMNVLEPEASDSFLKWGFFKIIFQQKEYFDPYSFVEKIPELIKNDPSLEEKFELYLKENPQFEKSAFMRLYFFYQNSPFYESHSHNLYPIYRIERKSSKKDS